MNVAIGSAMPGLAGAIKENASATVFAGVVLIIAGTLALLSPFVAGLSIAVLIGILIALGGVSHCVLAFKAGAFGRALLELIAGLLMIFAGLYMVSQPGLALASLTLVLAAYLIVAGVIDIFIALQLRPADGWGWFLFSAIITLLLGLMLWRQFPLSGIWAVGILIGVRMLSNGWALVFIGRSLKQIANDASSAA